MKNYTTLVENLSEANEPINPKGGKGFGGLPKGQASASEFVQGTFDLIEKNLTSKYVDLPKENNGKFNDLFDKIDKIMFKMEKLLVVNKNTAKGIKLVKTQNSTMK